VSGQIETDSADIMKNIAYQLRTYSDNTVMVIGSVNAGKANILVTVSDDLSMEETSAQLKLSGKFQVKLTEEEEGNLFLPLQEERILKACNVLSKRQLNS